MTEIIQSLDDIAARYRILFCDLWGCLHDGVEAFPEAVEALLRFRASGGVVVLLTNSPRPAASVAAQIAKLGVPRDSYDLIVTSGDAAQLALANGLFGRKVYHIGPERDLGFFIDAEGRPYDVERVQLEDAESIVCTGLFDDLTETPDDYRATLLHAKTRKLRLLCANPDIIVDVGDRRIYCAGAIAQAYAEAGGESFYFGKPHSPIYGLARLRLREMLGEEPANDDILCVGDGVLTDIQGAMGENLDALFISGGLAARETASERGQGPDPLLLKDYLRTARLSPLYAIAFLR